MTSEDRLSLLGLRFDARHGVHASEKETPQPFEVDVVLHADLEPASRVDAIGATADYGAVYERVREVVEGRSYDLIEALAGAIADVVLEATDAAIVTAVEVRVRKPEAPIGGRFDTVEAALVRRRPA